MRHHIKCESAWAHAGALGAPRSSRSTTSTLWASPHRGGTCTHCSRCAVLCRCLCLCVSIMHEAGRTRSKQSFDSDSASWLSMIVILRVTRSARAVFTFSVPDSGTFSHVIGIRCQWCQISVSVSVLNRQLAYKSLVPRCAWPTAHTFLVFTSLCLQFL